MLKYTDIYWTYFPLSLLHVFIYVCAGSLKSFALKSGKKIYEEKGTSVYSYKQLFRSCIYIVQLLCSNTFVQTNFKQKP